MAVRFARVYVGGHDLMVKTCENGHSFEKSSDWPVCPRCESERESGSALLESLGGPARRALENHGVASAADLAEYSADEVLSWHGIGKSSLPKLRAALDAEGLDFIRS